jgi:hypothetical protein
MFEMVPQETTGTTEKDAMSLLVRVVPKKKTALLLQCRLLSSF